MKAKKIIVLLCISIGMTLLMSTTCEKDDPENPENCEGVASASSSGALIGTYCFTEVTSYNYQPNNYVSLFAAQIGTNIGFDLSIHTADGAAITTGTYDCGPDGLGFVELINEGSEGGEFYKSQSGTLTVTQVNENTFIGSFNVVAVGYYNGESINFSGTINATGIVLE